MARHRSHSVEFKRQVAQEYLGGETLHGLAERHGISRNLIRVDQAPHHLPGLCCVFLLQHAGEFGDPLAVDLG
jgi:transposase-like protein